MKRWCNKFTVQLADNPISMVRRNALKAANQCMEEVQGEARIGCSRVNASLGVEYGDILALERFAMLITSRSRCQKLFDEGKMRF